MILDDSTVVFIILYRKLFIGNADEKCQHGGGGKRKRQSTENA
jgi:hypothetical protein